MLNLSIQAPQMQNPNDQRTMAAFVAQLNELLHYISDRLGTVRVVTSAPTSLDTVGDGKGNIFSEVEILDNATQSSRRVYHKEVSGNIRYLESD